MAARAKLPRTIAAELIPAFAPCALQVGAEIILSIAGNKSDLERHRVVPRQEAAAQLIWQCRLWGHGVPLAAHWTCVSICVISAGALFHSPACLFTCYCQEDKTIP